MQVLSSITTRPPEPIIAPAFLRESKSRGISRWSSANVRQPPEGPPICTALNFAPPRMPPPMSNMTSLRVVPIGTSIRPVLLILPVRAKALVPGLVGVPKDRNHSMPLFIMGATLAKVSTLFSTVGQSKRPCSTVRGGFTRGIPRLPSIEAVRALPSPQTKAPAPRFIWRWKRFPEPRILSPKSPAEVSCSMAIFSRSTANGYSARTYI